MKQPKCPSVEDWIDFEACLQLRTIKLKRHDRLLWESEEKCVKMGGKFLNRVGHCLLKSS